MVLINHNQINSEFSGPNLDINIALLFHSISIIQLHPTHYDPR